MIERKISTKKHCRGIEQYEKHSLAGTLLENGSGKMLVQSAVERDYKDL